MSFFLKHWYRLHQKAKDDIITNYRYTGGWRVFGKFNFLERDFEEILDIDGDMPDNKIGFKTPRKLN